MPKVCFVFLAALALLAHPASIRAKPIRAGAAQADITPPVGYRMAGYFNERLSTGTHDPLLAKAIVMQDGREKIALVFCDLVGLSLNVSTNARAQAAAQTGIPYQNILICCTHSHTGPLFEGVIRDYLHDLALKKEGKDSREEIDYSRHLTQQIVKTITEANANLQPASIESGIGKLEGLSFNRRYHMKTGKVAFNPGAMNTNIVAPAGPNDPDVGILFFRNAKDQKPFAGISTFATHADTIGGTDYSADYPFYLSQSLKQHFGQNYLSAFAASPCGDINHINVKTNEPVKGLFIAERIGTNIAHTVLRELPKLHRINKPSFAVSSETNTAFFKEVTSGQVADAKQKMKLLTDDSASFFVKVDAVRDLDIASKGPTWPMEVQAIRLDSETALVGLPCEIFVEIGLAIKKASPFKNTIVISIANDRPSYVPTKKAFAEGSYEVTNARVKPGTGEMLASSAIKLLQGLAQ